MLRTEGFFLGLLGMIFLIFGSRELSHIFIIFAGIWLLLIATTPRILNRNQSGGQNNLLQDLVFTSNTGLDELNNDRSSKYASFDLDKAWGGNPNSRYFTYLEVKLPSYTHLTGILTRGYQGQNEWVTEYYLEYWDDYREKWIKVDRMYQGNSNDNEVVYHQINLDTSRIRIYPISWQNYPSLKVSFQGEQIVFLPCQHYQIQSKEGPVERRDYYNNLYQQNCLKIDLAQYEKLNGEMQNMRLELDQLRIELMQEKEKTRNSCPREQLVELANKFRQYRENSLSDKTI